MNDALCPAGCRCPECRLHAAKCQAVWWIADDSWRSLTRTERRRMAEIMTLMALTGWSCAPAEAVVRRVAIADGLTRV